LLCLGMERMGLELVSKKSPTLLPIFTWLISGALQALQNDSDLVWHIPELHLASSLQCPVTFQKTCLEKLGDSHYSNRGENLGDSKPVIKTRQMSVSTFRSSFKSYYHHEAVLNNKRNGCLFLLMSDISTFLITYFPLVLVHFLLLSQNATDWIIYKENRYM
jgi:hypothetical protein